MLKYLSAVYDGTIIAPMTLIIHWYYGEMIGRLKILKEANKGE